MAKSISAIMDIGSGKITVLIGAKGVNNSFIVYGKSSVPYGGFADGEFLEPEKLSDVIGKAIENVEIATRFSIKELTVSVPAEFCLCRNKKISVTFQHNKKLNENIIDEIYANAVEYIDNYTLITTEPIYNLLDDGRKLLNVVNQKTTKLTCLVSTIYVNNDFLKIMNNCLSALAIQKVNYVSSTFATTSYFLTPDKLEGSAVLIDVGYITTELAIVRGGGLISLSSCSMGGGHVMTDLAECLKLDYKDAETLKRRIVLSLQTSPNDIYIVDSFQPNQTKTIFAKVANQIVFDRLDVLCSFIKKAIQEVSDDEYMPIYLTGAGISCIKGAKEYISSVLSQNIELLTPNLVEFNKPSDSSLISLLDFSLKKLEKKHGGMLAKLKK